MPRTTVRLTFSGEAARVPVIYEMGKKYQLVTNIRRANVTEDAGWIELEIDGEEAQLQQGLDYCRSRGVNVEPVGR